MENGTKFRKTVPSLLDSEELWLDSERFLRTTIVKTHLMHIADEVEQSPLRIANYAMQETPLFQISERKAPSPNNINGKEAIDLFLIRIKTIIQLFFLKKSPTL